MARRPKPWFRKSTQSWYVQLGGKQVCLGSDEEVAWDRYAVLMSKNGSAEPANVSRVDVILSEFLDWTHRNLSPKTYQSYGDILPAAAVWCRCGRRRLSRVVLLLAAFTLLLPSRSEAEDLVEFLSGAKSRGKVVARNDKYITFNVTIGTRTYPRKYPLSKIRAVTINGRREMLNETTAGSGTSSSARPGTGMSGSAGGTRSRTAVDALIEREGRTPPSWWDSVALNYPRTLDLGWPQPPPKGWNNQRNVGQYIWDIINPNPRKWQEGVRFLHHLLTVHQGDPATRQRVMNSLGQMYYALLQDYARAAFWWRKAGADRGQRFVGSGIHLAECYWRLGNKQMALELLNKLPLHFATIKLLGDIGETRRALQLADANTRGEFADIGLTYAAEICRVAGRYQDALQYYERLMRLPASGRHAKRIQRNQELGRANIEAIRLFELLDVRRVPDGTYRASSPAYAGMLHVEVTVGSGRIQSVRVTQHQEKQFYSAINDTTRKIVERQGFEGVDATSGATITSKAIINAAAKALATAMK